MRIDPKTFVLDANERSALEQAIRLAMRANETTLKRVKKTKTRETVETHNAYLSDLLVKLQSEGTSNANT